MNSSLSLKTRLTFAFALLGVLCLVIAGVGIRGLQNANERAQHTYESLTRPGQAFESSYTMTLVAVIQLMEGLASNDESTKQQRLDFIAQLRKDSQEQFAEFKNSPKNGSIKEAFAPIDKNQAKFDEVFQKAVQLFKEGKTAEALAVQGNELRQPGVELFKETSAFYRA